MKGTDPGAMNNYLGLIMNYSIKLPIMKAQFTCTCLFFLALSMFTSCTQDDAIGPDAEINSGDLVALRMNPDSEAPVFTYPEFEVVGSSQIDRQEKMIQYRWESTGAVPGDVITLWLAVFNDPGNCAGTPCNPNDLQNIATSPDLFYADGEISEDGTISFKGHLKEGDTENSVAPLFGGIPNGLVDAETADFILIARTHGQPIEGELEAQLTEYFGGCGTNFCNDFQLSIHTP